MPDAAVAAPAGRRARRRLAPFVAIAVGLALVGLVAVFATSPAASDREVRSPLLGQAAPAVDGTGLDGKPVSLASLRGQWVLVNFFATWCEPCRREHPELASFHQRHEQAGDASVLSVVFQDDEAGAASYFASQGGTWPVVSDPDGRFAAGYGVVKVPESYWVDPDGFVQAKVVGGVTTDGLDALLARLQAVRAQRLGAGS